ncbi:MAG TPA: 16S rRNA (guanine(527)-N(7))-methyltransferase RsmG [Thermoanaerobaculia bacterium]|nr:16S rRNA (guanine(527)-N(7))-methyltransferase RsmG [Thermoanaerobaculia bacterium]
MGFDLPALSRGELGARLRDLSPEPLSDEVIGGLAAFYEELRQWNRRLSLIGRGTRGEVLERHFGESLAALPLLPTDGGALVDLGSGAGFPALVLAVARPRWKVTLIESRQRKWAFLESVKRRAGLSCRCLNARVGPALPQGVPAQIDVITVRAVELSERLLAPLRPRLDEEARLLCWRGVSETPELRGFAPGREIRLAHSENRRIVELVTVEQPRATGRVSR